MNKADFVTGTPVRVLGTQQVMILGGTPDRWVCTWDENGQLVSRQFDPASLERVSSDQTSTK